MSRGRSYPKLADALATIAARDGLSAYRIHQELVRHPEKYDTPFSFSLTAVKNVIGGEPISSRTMELMTTYVRSKDDLLLPRESQDVDLDLGKFLFVRGPKLLKVGRSLEGAFQTYARSTTAEGYIRRGKCVFRCDEKKQRIRVEETQHRPKIEGFPTTTVKWGGNAVPKSEMILAVMRTPFDCQEATGVFYFMRPLLRNAETGQILSLKAQAMHFEPERGRVMHPEVYLVRMPEDEIQLDFVPMHNVTDGVVRMELALGPRLNVSRKVRSRAN